MPGLSSSKLPVVYIARHGETAWSLSGQHTSLTDLPLTERGEQNARALGARLRPLRFARVLTSPLQRARRTCELVGFGAVAAIDPDLVEWNYGQYEGLRTSEILAARPDWQLFRVGGPGVESPVHVGARAVRVLAARWLGETPAAGRYLALSTASLGTLGYERVITQPVISLWNDTSHLGA